MLADYGFKRLQVTNGVPSSSELPAHETQLAPDICRHAEYSASLTWSTELLLVIEVKPSAIKAPNTEAISSFRYSFIIEY